jgi:hypothetical protein
MKPTATIVFCFIISSLFSQKTDTLKYCLDPGQVGVGGFDPVTYFKSPGPLPGEISITATHDGVVYRFVSIENKNDFMKNPLRYLPQFGGWCSMTLAMGRATRPTYTNFLVQGKKLFLFERTLSVNGKEVWLKNPEENTRLAKATYEKLITLGKPAK